MFNFDRFQKISKRYMSRTWCPEEIEYSGEVAAILYLIAECEELWERREQIMNFEAREIKPEVLNEPWLTSGSRALIKLGFNLFNGYNIAGEEEEKYDVMSIFSKFGDTYFMFGITAIRIKFGHARVSEYKE